MNKQARLAGGEMVAQLTPEFLEKLPEAFRVKIKRVLRALNIMLANDAHEMHVWEAIEIVRNTVNYLEENPPHEKYNENNNPL